MLLSELIGTHFIQTQISNFLYSLCKRFEISLSTSLSLDYYNEGTNICYSRKFYSGQTNEKERKKNTEKKKCRRKFGEKADRNFLFKNVKAE